MENGTIQGLLDIWYYSEINLKNSIMNYLQDFNCYDEVNETALGMLANIDNTINQIRVLKKIGRHYDNNF